MTTRFVQTPILNIAYEDHGHAEGFPVVLLHGFPYDVRSWDQVLPSLVNEGYHVFVPYLRGYGLTTFLHEDSPRVAQQAAIAQDVVDFARALGIDRLAMAGFDWGNRAACIASILHPELVACLVAIGGYAVQNTLKRSDVSAPEMEARLWYQWYFNILEQIQQRPLLVELRPQVMVQPQRDIGVFRCIRARLLQGNLIEGQLLGALARHVFEVCGLRTEIFQRQ